MERYFRKIIHISAEDSPNVRLAQAQLRLGQEPTNEIVQPGVITYAQFKQRLATWDKIRATIGIYGRFWEGGETLLFPPVWLNRAERLHTFLRGKERIARAIGIDPGEGTSSTSFSIVDELGLIELVSAKTPNTNDVITITIDLIHRFKVDPEKVLFDRGGGGKQHADRLRNMGYHVRTVGFGDRPSVELKRGMTMFDEKVDMAERRYAYVNRRAEMYGELRILLDPASDDRDYESESAWKEMAEHKGRIIGDIRGFAISSEYTKLREQLAPLPLLTDNEQRMRMLPKHKKNEHSKEKTLVELIGYSPDEADSLVLAVHAMTRFNNVHSQAGAL